MTDLLMKAVGVQKALKISHPEALVDFTLPVPAVSQWDLFVQVEAVSVNPADCRMRARKIDDGTLCVLGWDVAGLVVDAAAAASGNCSVGDSVYYSGDLTRPGANSELHVVDSRIVGHRPTTLSATESAALPLTALSAWEALFDRIGFTIGENSRFKNLLIVGGAGGVGSMSIQLAKLIPGLQVIATASRQESKQWCLDLGADHVVNHSSDFRKALKEIGIDTVDSMLILSNPNDHFPVLADLISPHGIMCCLVPFEKTPDMNSLMRKSVTFTWEFMFTHSMFHTENLSKQRDILNEVSRLIDAGKIKTTATNDLGVICAENLRAAHQQIETHRTIGKLTLTGF